MNRQELARKSAANLGLPIADVLRVLEAMIADVERVVAGGGLVAWPRFGTFFARYRKPRLFRHVEYRRKRANRPGEGADKYLSISLPRWEFVFKAAKPLRNAISPRWGEVREKKEYAGAGRELMARLGGVVGTSSVEVADVMADLLQVITVRMAMQEEVRLDGFGTFGVRGRPRRRFSVVVPGGGRAVKWFDAVTVPRFVRQWPGKA